MTLIVLFAVVAWTIFRRLRAGRPVVSLVVVSALAVAATFTPNLALAVRDASNRVVPARLIGSHGMAHTLYIGLGAVPNRLGIVYNDQFGLDQALKVDPKVAYQSAEYLRIMRTLYLQQLIRHPLEVLRIYFAKFKMAVGYWTLGNWMLPLWGSLPLLLGAHVAANGGRLSCGERDCDLRLAVNVLASAFIGLIVLQSVVAMPSQFYAMPSAPLVVLMVGVSMESIAGAIRRARRRRVS